MSYARPQNRSLGATYRATPRRERRTMARAGHRALGSISDDLAQLAGAVKGIQSITQSTNTMFGSGSVDDQRKARAAFFGQSAIAGSITAARYLLGGLQQVGGNEKPYYQQWITTVSADATGAQALAAAQAQGPKWTVGDKGPGSSTSDAMVRDVLQDLQAIGKAVAAPGVTTTPTPTNMTTSGTRPVQTLPASKATAPFNYVPWVLAGGAVVAVLLLRER